MQPGSEESHNARDDGHPKEIVNIQKSYTRTHMNSIFITHSHHFVDALGRDLPNRATIENMAPAK